MSVIIFIIVLGVLIFVHELGHFLVAKWAKIRVDEFAIGFPPRIVSFVRGETRYALNLVPFGGYVKIFGENPDEESRDPNATNSFVNKNRWIQAAVLVAGVTFNILFAWALFSVSFMSGFPSIVTEDNAHQITQADTVITSILPDSPADKAGLVVGDVLHMLEVTDKAALGNPTVEGVQNFIATHGADPITIVVERDDVMVPITVAPEQGLVEGRPAIGISMNLIGELNLGFFAAIGKGAETTVTMIKEIAVGLVGFIADIFTGNAQFDQVAGPVGIVGLVGDATSFGFVYLLGFTAFISLNLAVLNLVPFPALDGGRLLFVLIEGITRRAIKPSVANTINAVGFGLLILLMVVITVSDVLKLF
jgi:regulator of sigma E protease